MPGIAWCSEQRKSKTTNQENIYPVTLGKTFNWFSLSFPIDLMAGLDILQPRVSLCGDRGPASSDTSCALWKLHSANSRWIPQTSLCHCSRRANTLPERLRVEVLQRMTGRGGEVWSGQGLGGQEGSGEEGPEGLDWLARWACQMLGPSCEISHPPAPYPPSSSSGWLSICIICPI